MLTRQQLEHALGIDPHQSAEIKLEGELPPELNESYTREDPLFWALVYAHQALEYIREAHPQIYLECGDQDYYEERAALVANHRWSTQ